MVTFVDYYEQVESALKSRILTLTDLFPNDWQVSSNDNVRRRGADNFFILMPGAFVERSQQYEKDVEWHATGDLYVRVAELEAAKEQFKQARAQIIWVVKNDETLGGTPNVWETRISAPTPPQFYWETKTLADSGALPNFITQAFDITITQRVIF